jgi:oligoendopeptidase F
MSETTTLPSRSEVPFAETWNLASVFATPADWDAACKTLSDLLPSLSACQGRLKEGPQVLLETIQKLEEAGTLMGKIFVYASNANAVDTSDQVAAARAGQARSVGARAAAVMAFFDPELMSIGFGTLKRWIAETPDLAFFAFYVDRL